MLSIPPFYAEWLRAVVMPVTGMLMLFLGLSTPRLSDRLRNGLSVAAVLLAIAAATAHYQPVRSILGPAVERIGGDGAVAGYALLLLVGIARAKTRSALLNIGACLAFVIILAFALSPLYWHYFGRRLYSNYPDKDGCIQQTTGLTCVPASASMLLSRYGFRVSEGLLAERAGTNPLAGTNEFSLARALERVTAVRGLKARAGHLTFQQARELSSPFIAYTTMPGVVGHAVLVTSLHPDAALISDPLTNSSSRMPIHQFKRKWTGTAVWIRGSLSSREKAGRDSGVREY